MRHALLRGVACCAIAALGCMTTGAQAAVAISSDATQNMSCSAGVCTATAPSAVLSVSDLESLLASSSLKVSTGGSLANDIRVSAAITWTSSSKLTLYAYRNVAIDKPISVEGSGGLDLESNRGSGAGYLTFGRNASATFLGLTNKLTIVGTAFTLVDSLAMLKSAISVHPSGHYALSKSYDASADGTYAGAPIGAGFSGTFDGLGNKIANLTIDDTFAGDQVGLFNNVASGGVVRHLILAGAHITGASGATVGGIAGDNQGLLRFDSVYGTVTAGASGYAGGLASFNEGTIQFSDAGASVRASGNMASFGGLVSANNGTIESSYATGSVKGGGGHANAGGLVGSENGGTISGCYATGDVTASGAHSAVGGLVGYAFGGAISGSYATGAVSGGYEALAGGLVGTTNAGVPINQSYATGAVSGGLDATVGGLAGQPAGTITDTYATGAVSGGAQVGGLVGFNQSTIATSYAKGAVTGSGFLGGLIGYDYVSPGDLSSTYWDTTTSGITDLSLGAGHPTNDPGVKGRTTGQLKAGLPNGFSSSVWGETAGVNGGLPYLLALPPA